MFKSNNKVESIHKKKIKYKIFIKSKKSLNKYKNNFGKYIQFKHEKTLTSAAITPFIGTFLIA